MSTKNQHPDHLTRRHLAELNHRNRLARFLITLAIWTGLIFSSAPATAIDNPKPTLLTQDTNVILISLQCLRPDHIGAYGYDRGTSPNIDTLAHDSVVFENAISQANLTPVAQMSVLTSQYPRVNGLVSFEVPTDMVSQRTLPEILKLYGYTTAATVSSPEFFLRYDNGSGTLVNPGDIFSRSFDYFGRTRRGPHGKSVRIAPTESLNWLRKNQDKKFFLWIASGLIHLPYGATVPEPYKSKYDPPGYQPFWQNLTGTSWEPTTPSAPSYDVLSRVFDNRFYWGFKPIHQLTSRDVDFIRGRYDAGIFYTDLFIGELVKLLDSLNLTEKTLIILQSIHGEDLGEQGNFFHYDVTDTVVKNALFFRFPGKKFAGLRVVSQMQGIDIMPTILDYLKIPAPHEAQGISIMPVIQGRQEKINEYAYIDRLPWWEYTLHKWYLKFKSSQGAHFSPEETAKLPGYLKLLEDSFSKLEYPPGDIAIRTNQWKMILRKNNELLEKVSWQRFITGQAQSIPEVELYNLHHDPLEKENVAHDNPEVVNKLREKLLAWDRKIEQEKRSYHQEDQRLIIPYP